MKLTIVGIGAIVLSIIAVRLTGLGDWWADELAQDIREEYEATTPPIDSEPEDFPVPTVDPTATISSFEHPVNHRMATSMLSAASLTSTTPPGVLNWALKAGNAYLSLGRRFDLAFVQESVFSAEGAIYGERGEWNVTSEEVVRVCNHLGHGGTLLGTEALIWDTFTWKQTAILGALTAGSREDGATLLEFCRQNGMRR